jgi:hypothetical protein
VWGSLGHIILARLERRKADDARAAALAEAIAQARTRHEKCVLVRQLEGCRLIAGFMDYLEEEEQASLVASGGCQDPAHNLLGLIAMEARLHDPELAAFVGEFAEMFMRTLEPAHIAPGPDDPDDEGNEAHP